MVKRSGRADVLEGFGFFDDEEDSAPVKLSPMQELGVKLGETPTMLSAEALLKPAGVALLATPAVYHFWKKRAWAVLVKPGVDLERAATKLFAELVSRRSLRAADPLLHDLTLYVVHDGGALVREPAVKAPKGPTLSDQKHALLSKAKRFFGASGAKLEGAEGAYKLKLMAVGKLKGKFASGHFTAATIAELETKLDQAIEMLEFGNG